MISPDKIQAKHKQWRAAVASSNTGAGKATTAAFGGCLAALKQLEHNLRDIGYPIEQIMSPRNDVDEAVKAIKSGTSFSPPPILAKFWRTIGSVELVDLENYSHCEFWKQQGITAEYCDGLYVDGCGEEWVDYVVSAYEDRQEDESSFEQDLFFFELSPDGYHKDNISGGEPYGLAPGSGWISLWKNFEWTHPPAGRPEKTDFMGYLRTAILECAGFPGLYGDPAFEPIRQRLLKDVGIF